jgi:membrane protease YdiL (CAAX protease family)
METHPDQYFLSLQTFFYLQTKIHCTNVRTLQIMSFIPSAKQENSPYLQLLMLIFYAVLGLLVSFVIAFIVLFLMYGMQLVSNPSILTTPDLKYRPALQILLFAQSVGLFLVPPILLSITEGIKINRFYGLKWPGWKLAGLVFLIIIVSSPVMEWVGLINQQMKLPEALKSIEEWMRRSEDSLMETTLLLLKMDSVSEFLFNIFLIAIIPAIAEEFMFRGAIQRIFSRIFSNPHIAIWFSAFVFSAIHMQFYGFLPRFLLGAGFGYLYYWCGNLWYSILAHFLNNAIAVCQAFYLQKNHLPMDTEHTSYFAWYGYVLSFVLTIIVFQLFKKQSK